jgi:hypothetical protein
MGSFPSKPGGSRIDEFQAHSGINNHRLFVIRFGVLLGL